MLSLDPTFETLARSITFQQLHGKAAATIFARVKKAVGTKVHGQRISETHDGRAPRLRVIPSENRLSYRSGGKSGRAADPVSETANARRCRSHSDPVAGERSGRLDRPDVPDVRARQAERDAAKRPGDTERCAESLRSECAAGRCGDDAHFGTLASVLHSGELVSVAEPRRRRGVVT